MILMPIVYVQDMDASLAFYERLGFEPKSRSAMWSELRAGDGAVLALHAAPTEAVGRVDLALVAEEPRWEPYARALDAHPLLPSLAPLFED